MKTLGSFFRDQRIKNRLKSAEVAEYLGIAQSTYSQYENDQVTIINSVFFKLAEYYNMHPADMLRAALDGSDHDFPYLVSEPPERYTNEIEALKQQIEEKTKQIGVLEYRLSKYEPVNEMKRGASA